MQIQKNTTIDGNTEENCKWPVTCWVESKNDVQFAIDQIILRQGKWQLKQNRSGKVAVFGKIAPRLQYHSHDSGIDELNDL